MFFSVSLRRHAFLCINSVKTINITYDNNGCVKTYDGWTYTWNKGKLAALSKNTANSASAASGESRALVIGTSHNYAFKYNAQGQRIEKKYTYFPGSIHQNEYLANCTSTYEYDLNGRLLSDTRELRYSDGSTINKKFVFIYEESDIVGVIFTNSSGTGTYYYDKNPRGDVIAILDNSGNTVVKYRYDAYGNCTCYYSTNNDLEQSNPIRYRSYYYDEDTGLYYLNARYYNPQWRRFISPARTSTINVDAVNGLNLYVYANSNPIGIAYRSLGTGGSAGGGIGSSLALGGFITGGNNLGYSNSINIFAGLNWPQLNANDLIKDSIVSFGEVGSKIAWGLTKNGSSFLDFHYVADGINGYTALDNLPSTSEKIFKGIGIGLMALDVLEAGYYSYQQGQSFGQGALNFGLTTGKNILVYKVSTRVATAAGTWAGAKFGASLGSAAGPVGFAVGTVAGAFIGWIIDGFGDVIIDWVVGWFD